MKLDYTPFLKGVQRHIDDVAQSSGGLRDSMNLLNNVTGRLDGCYLGGYSTRFGAVYNRIHQWDDYTLGLRANPLDAIQIGNTFDFEAGPTGDGRAENYNGFCTLAIQGEQAQILSEKTFLAGTTYLDVDAGNGFGQIDSSSGVGSVTVNFTSIFPQARAEDPQYIVFDIDGGIGSTSAEIRPITAFVTAGSDITSVTYTGGPVPANAQYAFIQFGADANDTFKPDGFVTHRERLAAFLDNTLYYAGFVGSITPFVEPDPLNPYYWYELNSVQVGQKSEGKIIKAIEWRDSIIVFLERAIYRVYGYPPINGAFDNQLVVENISDDLGITSYDAASLSTDGQTIFFIGNDSRLYALAGGIVEISEPIREHPRFKNLTIANCTDRYAIFTGETITPESVPFESGPVDGGLVYQTPPAFLFHIQKQEFVILDPYCTDSSYDIIPVNDLNRFGVFNTFELNGRNEICIGLPEGTRILNDPRTKNPQEYLCAGLSTHQIPISGDLFRADQVDVVAEATSNKRIEVVCPAENPIGNAPLQTARDLPASDYGITSRYGLFFSEPELHNYSSVTVGYGGERLYSGTQVFPPNVEPIPLTATAFADRHILTGMLDRVDVLMSDVQDVRCTIYADDNGNQGTEVLFYKDLTLPKSGLVDSPDRYWRSFHIGVEFNRPVWIGFTGNANIYRYPNNSVVQQNGSDVFSAFGIVSRSIKELGNSMSVRSVLSVSVQGELMANPW